MSLIRRNRPGTRTSDLYNWAPEDYSKKKGLFSVQEYIQELIRDNPANVKKIIEPPKGVDLNAWKYEHLRQFILETNLLIVQLKGICTKDTCPKMQASQDWLYLCAVHKEPQDCSAIDYMIHNLDQMSSNLNSSKYFSSRVSIDKSNMKYLEEIIRRLYKILPQYNAYKKPFSKEEYLKTSSVMIDGKLVKASEEEIDKCIEYMKQKNEWISGKTVSDCIRDYLKGEKDITLKVELSDLNNIQKDLEKRIEKIDRMEEKIKLKSRELGESER